MQGARLMVMTWDSSAIDARVRAAALQGVIAGVELVLETGNGLILSPPKSGKIYRRRGVDHQASAAGEAPANDLGGLVASSRASYPEQGDLFVIEGFATWSTVYARRLELGYQGGEGKSSTDPRPYARPALDVAAPEIKAGISAAISAEFVGSAGSAGAASYQGGGL